MDKKFIFLKGSTGLLVYLCLAWFAPAGVAQSGVSERHGALLKLADEIVRQHPNISHINLLEAQARQGKVTFIDVRTPGEFAVSRIPGAINISDGQALLEYARQHPQQQLVLYCSVGRRSAKFTELLHSQGVSQASNFVGSIFAWGNVGLGLENDAGMTKAVHPFNWFWGWRYLDASLHASQPREVVIDQGLTPPSTGRRSSHR
ncbi:MAG: rhodanese-like domain-containing protein [Pseudomonadota bacterium]